MWQAAEKNTPERRGHVFHVSARMRSARLLPWGSDSRPPGSGTKNSKLRSTAVLRLPRKSDSCRDFYVTSSTIAILPRYVLKAIPALSRSQVLQDVSHKTPTARIKAKASRELPRCHSCPLLQIYLLLRPVHLYSRVAYILNGILQALRRGFSAKPRVYPHRECRPRPRSLQDDTDAVQR